MTSPDLSRCGGVLRAACALWLASIALGVAAAEEGDQESRYQVVSGLSGDLSSSGSDTLANLMTLWSEAFTSFYPRVNVQVQAAGSSTAPPALAEGTANLGPMSRRMKHQEREAFAARFGYKPTAIRVAMDALVVLVHKDNPLAALSLDQVDAVFSQNRRCGAAQDVARWGELGLSGSWQRRPLQLYGRNSVSGTYGYFKRVALCAGDFKNTVNEQPGSASVVQATASSLNGIGFSGIGYMTSGVRAVPLSEEVGEAPVEPSPENTRSGRYPLARYLYLYVNKPPNGPLPVVEKEFLRMVLSREGQDIVAKDGYVPLPQNVVRRELKRLDRT